MDIEGDPRSPISEGCLCPKGAATFQLVTGAHREQHVLYRAPFSTEWRRIPLERAMEMLRRAVAAGYWDIAWMRRDPDLDPLRPRADFQVLLLDLAFPADPFTR